MNRFTFFAVVLALISLTLFVQTQFKQDFFSAETVQIELLAYNSENELILNQTVQAQIGKNAFQILQENTPIEYQDFSFGKFITSIHGLKADSSKEYWAFYVNGNYSNVGLQDYRIEKSAKLEFKLEKIQ